MLHLYLRHSICPRVKFPSTNGFAKITLKKNLTKNNLDGLLSAAKSIFYNQICVTML